MWATVRRTFLVLFLALAVCNDVPLRSLDSRSTSRVLVEAAGHIKAQPKIKAASAPSLVTGAGSKKKNAAKGKHKPRKPKTASSEPYIRGLSPAEQRAAKRKKEKKLAHKDGDRFKVVRQRGSSRFDELTEIQRDILKLNSEYTYTHLSEDDDDALLESIDRLEIDVRRDLRVREKAKAHVEVFEEKKRVQGPAIRAVFVTPKACRLGKEPEVRDLVIRVESANPGRIHRIPGIGGMNFELRLFNDNKELLGTVEWHRFKGMSVDEIRTFLFEEYGLKRPSEKELFRASLGELDTSVSDEDLVELGVSDEDYFRIRDHALSNSCEA